MNIIKAIRTSDGDYKIDYNSLANLPSDPVVEILSATKEFHPEIGGSWNFRMYCRNSSRSV